MFTGCEHVCRLIQRLSVTGGERNVDYDSFFVLTLYFHINKIGNLDFSIQNKLVIMNEQIYQI